LNLVTFSDDPPEAEPATRFFQDPDWDTVPAANGPRELLNFLAQETGYAWGLVSGGVGGNAIAFYQQGAGNGAFETLAAKLLASGNDAAYMLWHQGEGNGNSVTGYTEALQDIHADFCTAVGRTQAQMPLILSSLATWPVLTASDAGWKNVQAILWQTAEDDANIYYSHSNMDAEISDAGGHWTAISYGRSARRYAQAVAKLLGTESAFAAWFIAGATIIDATHTDVAVTHSMGTDFTPTSGITGFEISNDGGSNWEAPSAAVRQDATTIRLTHTSMATSGDRLIRYQYGQTPDVSGCVKDNSALASPLNHSAHQTITATGL
jgi:hypothetical protein